MRSTRAGRRVQPRRHVARRGALLRAIILGVVLVEVGRPVAWSEEPVNHGADHSAQMIAALQKTPVPVGQPPVDVQPDGLSYVGGYDRWKNATVIHAVLAGITPTSNVAGPSLLVLSYEVSGSRQKLAKGDQPMTVFLADGFRDGAAHGIVSHPRS